MITQVPQPRAEARRPTDYTVGCGEPEADYQPDQLHKTGRVCAGTGGQASCLLCPYSPTYWRGVPGTPETA